MLKHLKENAAILLLSTGLFATSLIAGVAVIYGLDKVL